MSASLSPVASSGLRLVPGPGTETSARQRPGTILRGISRVWRTATLYGKDHPVLERLTTDLLGVVETLLAERPSLTIVIHEETFFVDNTMLLEESVHVAPLLGELKKRGVLGVTVHRGLEVREALALVAMLNTPVDELRRQGGAAAWLGQRRVEHIVVASGRPAAIASGASVQVEPHDAYRAGVRVMEDLYGQASSGPALDLKNARIVVESLVATLTEHRSSLMAAAVIKNFDGDTCRHSVNVCILSLFMASRLGLDRSRTATLGLSALLHDIGKVRVPIEILTKPARLSEAEWTIMQRHTLYGAQMLSELSGLARLAMVVAFEHHANYDLTGYPRLTGRQHPHPLARIVQIVDAFDAATSARRAYRRPVSPAQAVRFVRDGAGGVYDPGLAAAFVCEFGMYPVGTVVELDSGAVGIVCQPGACDPDRPRVRIIDPRAMTPVVLDEVDLEATPERSVARILDAGDLGIDVTDYVAPAR
ncbi:MAG: HD-GYP domain-containing protein [Armatimonadota bacterium]|nr:HD-GYP domain-containing protein [Armatimonadota bacterium]